jgi:hypothetical protein
MMRARVPDVFVCHASEDKEAVVRPLAEALQRLGYAVWYDEFVLKAGDSLRRRIDHGLSASRYGVVVLSTSFFQKNWPQYELDGLVQRENDGGAKVIIPIWHGVDVKTVAAYSPTLADRVAILSSNGLDSLVSEITAVLDGSEGQSGTLAVVKEAAQPPARELGRSPDSADSVDLNLTSVGRAVGRPITDPAVQSLLGRFSIAPELSQLLEHDERHYRSVGVSFVFTRATKQLATISFYSGKSRGFSRYAGRLPKRLSFDDRRRDVEARIGRGSVRSARLERALWATYNTIGLRIHYAYGPDDDLERPIELITIFKPSRNILRTVWFGGLDVNYLE